jgi:3-hydroxyisobutyrate dehydrogenase
MKAFLGTGLLGANFTRALLKHGEKVRVWNRTPEKAKALEIYGAESFEKVEEAVRTADRIHLTLSDDQAVDEVLEKACAGFAPGAILIDHTTTSVPGAARRSAYWKQKGYPYIHAPVFMGPPNALDGTGTMLISGDRSLVKSLETELSLMTGKLWNLGEEPQKAAAIKLLGNLFHIGLTGSISDLLTLAGTVQVPSSELAALLEVLNPAVVAQGRLKKITSKTFDQPSWELSMARKDARLMMEQAGSVHQVLPVVAAVAGKMDLWLAKGRGKEDWTIFSQDLPEK